MYKKKTYYTTFMQTQKKELFTHNAQSIRDVIRYIRRFKNAKVVMVSALGKEELVKKSLMLGAKSYIVKPLDRKKVLERIAKVLN